MSLHYDERRHWLVLSAPALALALGGCADARGRFDEYRNRLQRSDAGSNAVNTSSCTPPEPESIAGPALLAIDTSLTTGHPILFLGDITTPAMNGTTAVDFRYRALDSLDRHTRVGAELEVGPYALQGAELVADVPSSTLPGDANPIVHGVPITSEMTLTGRICGVQRFYCGTLTGSTSGYVSGPFTGNFAITLLDSSDRIPDRPRYGCGDEDLAPPLGN